MLNIPCGFRDEPWGKDGQGQRSGGNNGEDFPVGEIVRNPWESTRGGGEEQGDRHVRYEGTPFWSNVLQNWNEEKKRI